MTVEELLEHADRLEADLLHKQHEIEGHMRTSPYSRETLSLQCRALSDRVSEIRRQCAAIAQERAAAVGVALAA